MPVDIEVTLKIPSFTTRSVDQPDKRVDNSTVRFTKRIVVETIPKVGELLPLSMQYGEPFECAVTRVEWDDRENIFVLSCAYAKGSITADQHRAFLADPGWNIKHLP